MTDGKSANLSNNKVSLPDSPLTLMPSRDGSVVHALAFELEAEWVAYSLNGILVRRTCLLSHSMRIEFFKILKKIFDLRGRPDLRVFASFGL